MPTDTLAAARGLTARGLSVVPLPYGEKKAVLAGWQNLRLGFADLPRYFNGKPSNLGVLCGTPSNNMVAVDLDCREALTAAPFFLPPTGMRFGRASAPTSHWAYRTDAVPDKAHDKFIDPTATAARTADELVSEIIPAGGGEFPAPGRTPRADGLMLEIISTGGQVVVPPSVYPADPAKGRSVEEPSVWADDGGPAFVPMADLRAAVLAVAAAALLGRHWPAGSRHDAALAVAGGLLRAGWAVERVEAFVTAVCAAAGDKDAKDRLRAVADTATKLAAGGPVAGWPTAARLLGEAVVDRVQGWLGVAYPAAGPRAAAGRNGKPAVTPRRYVPLPEWRPFPVHCLPAPWAEFARQGAAALRCDPAFVALPIVSVLAGAIGNARRVYLGGEWFEPSVWWSCIVGASGTQKSPAAELSVNLVNERQKRLMAEYKDALRAYRADLAAWKAENRGRGEDAEGRPERPVVKRVMVSDITIEKLSGILEDNPRGVLAYRDELSGWYGSFRRYKGASGGTDEPNWLSIHGARAILYDRKTGEKTTVYVPHAAVSVTGGTQPRVLARVLGQESFDSGLVARVTFAMPPRVPKQWSDDAIDAAVKDKAIRSLDALFTLPCSTDADGTPRPTVLKLSAEAKVRFRRFVNEWGRRQFSADEEMAAALAKLEGMAARYALIHHVATRAEAGLETDAEVGLASVEAGVEVVTWAAAELERVYAVLRESDEERSVRALVDLIRRHGGSITPAELRATNRPKYPRPEDAEVALDVLVGHGLGGWLDVNPGPRGGRPTKTFVLHPQLPETTETPDTWGGRPPAAGDGGDTRNPYPVFNSGSDPASECDATPESADGNGVHHGRGSAVSVVSGSGEGKPDGSSNPGRVVTTEEAEAEGSQGVSGSDPGSLGYTLIADAGALVRVTAAVTVNFGPVGLDTETSGLDPRTARVRLIQLAVGPDVFLIDVFALPQPTTDLADLFAVLAAKEIVGHNLAFDLRMLAPLGFVPGRVFDTMIASQVLHAGERTATNAPLRHGLDDAADRELGRTLDKAHQKADWSKAMTPAMLAYAAADAAVLVPLAEALVPRLDAAGLSATAEVEMRALPGVAWSAPVAIDRPVWLALAAAAAAERDRLAADMDAIAPDPNGLPGMASRNWDSPRDVAAAFAAVGVTVESTDDDALAGIAHPLAEAMRQYRSASKQTGTFGKAWLDKHARDGSVLCRWNQLGAESGRMSAADPNLQQVPREAAYRRCFAARHGAVLVKADYSQIELRIAAKVADEPAMIEAYRRGDDLHALTAASVLGKPLDAVSKADRQLAKAVNFGLLFGMGWRGLRNYAKANYGLVLTEAQAQAYRAAFFRAYPALRRWHAEVGGRVEGQFRRNPAATHEVRTLGGRRRVLSVAAGARDNRYPNVTEALNYPVQGTAADGLKAAVALLWERRAKCSGAVPVLFVHDEIVVEVPAGQAVAAAGWLKRCMVDGMAPLVAPVPVEVEVSVGPTWGG